MYEILETIALELVYQQNRLEIKEIYELKGRDPNILYEEARKKNREINDYSIRYFRLAVYYSENINQLQKNKLHPDDWA